MGPGLGSYARYVEWFDCSTTPPMRHSECALGGQRQQLTRLDWLMRPQDCSAGDSAAYQRRNSTLDDVVIVAALRTPLTKVSSSSKKL